MLLIEMIKKVLTLGILIIFLSLALRHETHAAVFDVTDPYAGPAAATVNGSFAWALSQVNGATSGAGPHTIRFTTAMTLSGGTGDPSEYTITKDNITIDAESLTGASCGNPVVLWMGPGSQSFVISGNTVSIKGMIINDFRFDISGANFTMSNCWFGLDATGTAPMGGGNEYYISLSNSAVYTNIDGATCKNVFAGNTGINNAITSASANSIIIADSYFGMDKTGLNRILSFTGSVITVNSSNGMDIIGCVINGAPTNKAAVELSGIFFHTVIKDNYIGVNINGTYSSSTPFWGNEGTGIWQSSGTISTGSFTNNVISKNKQFGVLMEGDLNSDFFTYNTIGLSAGGNVIAGSSYGNGLSGMCFTTGTQRGTGLGNNIICQNGSAASSVINPKETCGIVFYNTIVSSAYIMNNYIGIDQLFNKGGNTSSGLCFFQCGNMGNNDVNNVTVTQNFFGDNGETPSSTDINSSGISVYSSNYILIANNHIGIGSAGENIGNAANGIELSSVNTYVISGNQIANNKGRRSLSEADAVGGIMTFNSQNGQIINNVISGHSDAGGIYNCQNNGIVIQQGGTVMIGGTAANTANTIVNNGTHGIHVFDGADFVQITQNIITCNASMGISLNISGDPGTIVSKSVGNNGYGATEGPTINLIGPDCSSGVTGSAPLNSLVEIYNSPICKTCPNILRGEGETYIGNTPITSGNTYFYTSALSGTLSATATGNSSADCNVYCRTSRFSDCMSCPLPTNVTTHSSSDAVKIYPNPFTVTLNILLVQSNTERVEMKIYDITGRVVFLKSFTATSVLEEQINLEYLPKGLYIVNVSNGININYNTKCLKEN